MGIPSPNRWLSQLASTLGILRSLAKDNPELFEEFDIPETYKEMLELAANTINPITGDPIWLVSDESERQRIIEVATSTTKLPSGKFLRDAIREALLELTEFSNFSEFADYKLCKIR